jgi:hypothetical protein
MGVSIAPLQSVTLEAHVSVIMLVGPDAQQNSAGALHIVPIPQGTLYVGGPVSTTEVSGNVPESRPEPESIGTGVESLLPSRVGMPFPVSGGGTASIEAESFPEPPPSSPPE